MARVRKSVPTFDSIFFATAEQRLIRLLLSEPGVSFTPRMMASKLKGVRGLGGPEGIMKILTDLEPLGLVDFVDNHRAVRIQEDNSIYEILRKLIALCDLEGLRHLLEPISSRGILYGFRASGQSDSKYELFVVSETTSEVEEAARSHPMSKSLELTVWTPEAYSEIETSNSSLAQKLMRGMIIWGSAW